MKQLVFLAFVSVLSQLTYAGFKEERKAILDLAGCFTVDYSYSEDKVLDKNYKLDSRIYDANRFIVKEYIKVIEDSGNRIRLQHFMQAENDKGENVFQMRHHGEEWIYEADHYYDYLGRFDGSDLWQPKYLSTFKGHWVRKIISLDDGPRHQCHGHWKLFPQVNRFECRAFSPIPGREYRDMKRKDYNTMMRNTEVVSYKNSWLERQTNEKIIFSNGHKKSLVREQGKIWSVRLPNKACRSVKKWARKRQGFWNILSQVWNDVMDGSSPFQDVKMVDGSKRSDKIRNIMKKYENDSFNKNSHDIAKEIQDVILKHQK